MYFITIMNIQSIKNSNNLSYKAICLNNKELIESKKLLLDLTNSITDKESAKIKIKILNLFDKHLKKELNIRCKRYHIREDFLQEIYLHFFEIVENIRKKITNPDDFLELVNKFKHSRYVFKSGVKDCSLDANLKGQYEDYKEFLKEKDLPIYSRLKTNEEKEIIKNKLLKILNNANLNKLEIDIIREKLKGLPAYLIANNMGLSHATIVRTFARGIAKVQDKNDVLPQDFENLIKIFVEKCGDKKLEDKIRKFLIKYPFIVAKDRKTLLYNIKNSSKLLGITEGDFIKASFRQPQILYQYPETLNKNVEDFVNLEKIPKADYVKAASDQPSLFYQDPNTLIDKLEKNSKICDLSKEEYIKIALRQPQLFYMLPVTTKQRIEEISKTMNIKKSDVVNLIKNNPTTICHKAEEVIKKLNLYKVYDRCKKIPLNTLTYYSNSYKYIYDKILLNLLKKHYGYNYVNSKNLIERIKQNPDAIYNFKLLKNDTTNGFIEYAENIFKENLGYSNVNYILEEI